MKIEAPAITPMVKQNNGVKTDLYAVVKMIYGKEVTYLMGNDVTEFAIKKLTGKQTLSHADIVALGMLGFNVHVNNPYAPQPTEGQVIGYTVE